MLQHVKEKDENKDGCRVKEKVKLQYGYVYTPGQGIGLTLIPETGLPVPGTSLVFPDIFQTPPPVIPGTFNLPISGAVIPLLNSGSLVNIEHNPPFSVKTEQAGDINMQYTVTINPRILFPGAGGLIFTSASITLRTAIYAVYRDRVLLVPGTDQLVNSPFVAAGAFIVGISAFVFQTQELVGQAIHGLPAGTRLFLVLTATASNIIASTARPVPELIIATPTIVAGVGQGGGTLASLEVVQEGPLTERSRLIF